MMREEVGVAKIHPLQTTLREIEYKTKSTLRNHSLGQKLYPDAVVISALHV